MSPGGVLDVYGSNSIDVPPSDAVVKVLRREGGETLKTFFPASSPFTATLDPKGSTSFPLEHTNT